MLLLFVCQPFFNASPHDIRASSRCTHDTLVVTDARNGVCGITGNAAVSLPEHPLLLSSMPTSAQPRTQYYLLILTMQITLDGGVWEV